MNYFKLTVALVLRPCVCRKSFVRQLPGQGRLSSLPSRAGAPHPGGSGKADEPLRPLPVSACGGSWFCFTFPWEGPGSAERGQICSASVCHRVLLNKRRRRASRKEGELIDGRAPAIARTPQECEGHTETESAPRRPRGHPDSGSGPGGLTGREGRPWPGK